MPDGEVVPLVSSEWRARRRDNRRAATHTRRAPPKLRRALGLSSLGVLLFGAPLLFNGAFGWTVLATAAFALVALGLSLWAAPNDSAGSAVGLCAVLAVLWTALHAAPLPVDLVRRWKPAAVEGAREAAEALGQALGGFVPGSLDPGATRERTLAALAVAAAYLAAALLSSLGGERGRTDVLRLSGAAVGAVVVVSLAHMLADTTVIYGVHAPRFSASHVPSPLMNPNHLGGFCAFGTVLSLGLAVSARHTAERSVWAGLSLTAGGLAFATLSRGAIGALGLGVVAFALAHARLEAREGRRRGDGGGRGVTRAVAVFAAAVAVLSTAAWVGVGRVVGEFSSGSWHKVEVHREALRLVRDYPLTGVGRGAFSAAFAPVMGGSERYVHPENVVLQWATEWGLPFTAALLVTLVGALLGGAWRTRSVARLGATLSIVILGLQNLVDFGLEMVGEAVVVAAVAGAVTSQRTQPSKGAKRWLHHRALGFGVLATGLILTPLLGPSVARGGVASLTESLEEALARGDHARFATLLPTAMTLHPREPNFALLAAGDAVARRDPSAPRWLTRAMTRAPYWPAPRLLAAQWLLAHGRTDQAMLELREAEMRVAGSSLTMLCELLRREPVEAWVDRAAPRAPEARLRVLSQVARCLPLDSPVTRYIDDVLISEEASAGVGPLVRAARRALAAGDFGEAVAVLEPYGPEHGRDASFAIALADALAAAGRTSEAARALDGAEAPPAGRRRLLVARARAYARAGRADDIAAVLGALRGLAGGSAHELARASLLEGETEELLDRPNGAVRAYREADRLDPESGGLERAARVARRTGNHTQSYQLYSALCTRNGPGSPACERLRAVRGNLRPLGAPLSTEAP